MSDAHRGVIYTQKVVSDPSVAREMTALSDRAAQIQKMLGNFQLGGLDLSQFQTGVERAHASLEALHQFAMQPAAIGAPSMATQPGVVSQMATYPAATLPPAVTLPPATPAPAEPAPPEAPEAPKGELKDLKGDLEKMTAAHKAAEDKLLQQTKQSAQAREAANAAAAKAQAEQEAELTARAAAENEKRLQASGARSQAQEAANAAAAKVQAAQEAELTAKAAAENEKRSALPERVVKNRIAMLARLQKFEAEKEAQEKAAADKQIAQLQKTADAEQKAADRQATAAQKAADKQATAAQKAAEAAQKAADKQAAAAQKAAEKDASEAARATERKKAELDKAMKADEKYWESFVKFGEESQKKRAEQNERAAEEHERAVAKLEHANIRLRRSLTEALVGTTELARGFTELGLVGEEDMEKIKDAILGVQSAVDLVHGGVSVWNALAESAHLYHERLVLIKEAEEAAAAVHAATSTAGAAAAAGTAAASGASSTGALGTVIAAAGPLGLALAGLVAAGMGAVWAINKYKDSVEAEAKRDQEKRKEELEIREQQNAALLQIFAAEKQARQQTEAREAAALKLSQEFGPKRGEYEAEAERRGLKGQAAQQSVADQAAIDQNRLALEQAKKDLEDNKRKTERSRNPDREVGGGESDRRLEEIRRQKEELDRREKAERAWGATDHGSVVQEIQRKRRELMGEESQALAARSGAQFAADAEAEKQATQEAAALRQKIEELEMRDAELSREQFRHETAALNDELQKQQELIAGDKERVKSAVDYAKQQHDAMQSALAGFAQLTKGQQQRLVTIQHKLDRGEKLTRSEEEFGAQHLGTKGKKQLEERQAGRVDQQTRDTLFGEEQEKDARGQQQLVQALQKSAQHIDHLAGVMARIEALNARAAGGEKSTVEINAQGHAELVVKWDQKSSQFIAKAIKPELDKWQAAIDEMLERAKAEIKSTLDRTIQRKSQKGNAGAG